MVWIFTLSLLNKSGNIRKQLGPVTKRLEDRITEAHSLLADADYVKLKTVRSKVVANIKSHETLTLQLRDAVPENPDEA